MLKVSSVVKLIASNFDKELQVDEMLTATLLHDMGKIVKFKLGLIPNSLEPQGIEYWKKVQTSFREKYGSDEERATQNLLDELGMSKRIKDLVANIGFMEAKNTFEVGDIEMMICCYADQRVSPFGISTLEYRIEEGRVHYRMNNKVSWNDTLEWEGFAKYTYKIEEQIFKHCKIKSEEITDKVVAPIIEELKSFKIITN